MKFFWLRNPEYPTDQADSAANPVEELEQVIMPGIHCSICGSSWAGNRKLYLQLPFSPLWSQMTGGVLPELEWKILADQVKDAAQLPSGFDIYPGDKLGIPTYKIQRRHLHDFVHPFPGTLIVKEKVVRALKDAGVKGFQPVLVRHYFSSKVECAEDVSLYALKIEGQAWHPGITRRGIETCTHCGRTRPPTIDWHSLDEQRWDRNDMLYVDLNPNMVIVTEHVCQILREAGLSNWHCA